jgi:Ca-activated chloride channel homolog
MQTHTPSSVPSNAPYLAARQARLNGPDRRTGFGPVITPTVSQRFAPRLAPHLTHFVPMAPMSKAARALLAASLAAFSLLVLVLWSPAAHAFDSDARKAESPYFHVKGGEAGVDHLPLKHTRVDVRIAGVIADVTVTQRYRNEGQRTIEAKYIFPGSTKAAVHAMNVRIGERLVVAQIREKEKARLEFQQAQRNGQTAALLEQERPNVFSMNVANILPGDAIDVELRYSELITPDDGKYAFVFPTVVGPRYHSPNAQAGTTFPSIPYLRNDAQGAATARESTFEMAVQFASPLPVSDIRSTSHPIEVMHEGQTDAKVELGQDSAVRNNRDFILEYRLAGTHTATGLVLHQGKDENFFLAVVEPPKAIPKDSINPREYVFVVDISGSMHGHPLQTAKTLLRDLIGHLRPSDTFNVMLFSGSAAMLNDRSVPATQANIDHAMAVIDRQQGGGSTEIVPALKKIASLPKNSDVARSVIVVTDGYVMVENEVFALIRKNLGNSNVFAFGIGSSVNRHLIEGIARAGQGEAFVVTKPTHAAEQAKRLRQMIESPVLTGLKLRVDGLDVYDVEPQGALQGKLPDVLGGRPVVIQGKWRGAPTGSITLEGQAAQGTYSKTVTVGTPDVHAVALQHLWARQRIAELSDQEALEGGQSKREPILALGLKYTLLTKYTSFIAVDKLVRAKEPAVPVTQPLPLPEGVSELALRKHAVAASPAAAQAPMVGAHVPTTPEPATWLALLVVLAALLGATPAGRSLVVRVVSRRPACVAPVKR